MIAETRLAAVEAVLFDKDGTLIDFALTFGPACHAAFQKLSDGDAAAFQRLCEALHYDSEGKRFADTSPFIAGTTQSFGPLVAQALRRDDRDALYAEFDQATLAEGLRFLAPIGAPASMLAALKAQGIHCGIATNDGEAAARAQAQALHLLPHLDFIVGYDSGHGEKPAAGQIEAFARACGVAPAKVAMLGDSTHDLHAARACGALAVAVLSGPAKRAALEPHADMVFDHAEAFVAALLEARLPAGPM